MQFTSIIIVALLAVSTSTVTADQKSYNLRSGRKLQEEKGPNLRGLETCYHRGCCGDQITITSEDNCMDLIYNALGDPNYYLQCQEAGHPDYQTCTIDPYHPNPNPFHYTKENSKLIVGDSCKVICPN